VPAQPGPGSGVVPDFKFDEKESTRGQSPSRHLLRLPGPKQLLIPNALRVLQAFPGTPGNLQLGSTHQLGHSALFNLPVAAVECFRISTGKDRGPLQGFYSFKASSTVTLAKTAVDAERPPTRSLRSIPSPQAG
jgi:hypothetical protein